MELFIIDSRRNVYFTRFEHYEFDQVINSIIRNYNSRILVIIAATTYNFWVLGNNQIYQINRITDSCSGID